MSNINLNGVRVDDQTGRVSFSGVQSGIDTQAAINNIITARRIPIDRIETEIDRNREVIAGVSDWRTLMSALQSKASALYGQISIDSAGDVFESKQAFANTTRDDGATSSQANALIGVTLDNDAELAVQNFEILQRATQQEVVMGQTEDFTVALGIDGRFKLGAVDPGVNPVPPGFTGGIDLVGGDWESIADIVIDPSDTLANIRDKINATNAGATPSGVSAQLITTGATEGYLKLVADTPGEQIDWVNDTTFPTGSVLARLDIVDAGVFVNETVAANKAQIALTDLTDAEKGAYSKAFSDPTDTAATPTNQVRMRIEDLQGGLFQVSPPALVGPGPISPLDIITAFGQAGDFGTAGLFDAGDVSGISDGVAGNGTNPGFNESAARVPPADTAWVRMNGGAQMAFFEMEVDENGMQRLHAFISDSNDYYDPDRRAATITFEDFGGGTGGAALLEDALDLGFDPVIVERSTNQIDDLFKGVTLDLLKAEPGTNIELDVQRDLNAVKTAITDFVEAYNEVVRFGNLQRQIDSLTGEPVEEASLYGTSVLGQTESLFELLSAQPAVGIKGVDTTLPPKDQIIGLDFRLLAQIGIDYVSLDASEANPLERKTLEINDSDLDNALLTNFEAVEALFSTKIQINQSNISVTGFTGDTDFANGGGIRVNFDPTVAANFGATLTYDLIDVFGTVTRANAGTVELSESGQFTFNDDGPANGLTAFYSGLTPASASFPPPATYTTVDFSMSKGIGNNFFFGLDRLIEPSLPGVPGSGGSLSAEIDQREADSEIKRTRVNEQLERLDRERIRLTEQFNRMEAALAELESLKQQVAAAFGQTSDE